MNLLTKKAALPATVIAFTLLTNSAVTAQQLDKSIPDTTKPKTTITTPGALTVKPYKDVVTANARTMKSFFTVHQVADRYLFEIPDSMLGREVLVVNRIDKAPVDNVFPLVLIGYAGDEVGKSVISFEKIPGDRLALRSILFKQFANDSSDNSLSRSLQNSNYQGIAGIFPVKAYNKEARTTVIDLTDFINADNSTISFEYFYYKSLAGNFAADKSFVDNVSAYPQNIEIRTVKTYNTVPSTFSTKPATVTYRFNNSLLLLPKEPMKARLADPRVGFFSNTYTDFDVNPYGVANTKYILRWRMEPKEEDMDRYRRGELVEPKKPIVIYIDPATPKKWVPYLIQGINDWQVAFEKAGFKNAIMGKEAPVDDSTWSVDDARHSVIVYKPSPIANAMGPNINDPRSGEILETHISWYHSVMTLVKRWYTIQAGAIDPRTHQPELNDTLMGQLIRFVSSHEVGHTLGLQHNFGSSSTVPVEKLRDKKWVEEHGHTPSIMDYARFNYVAQPEDGIGEKGIFPLIGEYDKWAIEWGYKLIPEAKTAMDEKPVLNNWVVNKLASGKQYFYGSQMDPITNEFPLNTMDPRDQSEDLGDDAVLASTYGIKNLKRIKPHLIEWFKKPGDNYAEAGDMYEELVKQYRQYVGHVARYIGGYYMTPKTVEQPGPQYELVEGSKQRRAMLFLQEQLFSTPYWLMDETLFTRSKVDFSIVTTVQKTILLSLLNSAIVSRLLHQEAVFSSPSYTAQQMLEDLKKGIFSELSGNQPISLYRRELQDTYIEALVVMLAPPALSNAKTIVKAHAIGLASQIKAAEGRTTDSLTRQHLTDMYERLQGILYPRSQVK